MTLHTFRVTVRGRFDGLTDATREALLATVDQHSWLNSAFTEAGTLTYGPELGPFTFRYQLSAPEQDGAETATTQAGLEALATLEALGCGHTELRLGAVDMDEIPIRRKGRRAV
ncbi:DUF6204 family protein [Kitasatospora sp. MAP5-34]|uniref:DUF6204 family protein n=1 Tax=Kitasatospora sp. MAP5-34 TaxID=3035102 RepID=UPI002474E0AE|nr:DUF6204 family protein [Kitasatospora sp. MAP5-34]MDH6580006.1 hypothetical protein [Kitasatospora sp. MAP5-34]